MWTSSNQIDLWLVISSATWRKIRRSDWQTIIIAPHCILLFNLGKMQTRVRLCVRAQLISSHITMNEKRQVVHKISANFDWSHLQLKVYVRRSGDWRRMPTAREVLSHLWSFGKLMRVVILTSYAMYCLPRGRGVLVMADEITFANTPVLNFDATERRQFDLNDIVLVVQDNSREFGYH